MIDCAKANDRFLMEAMWSRFFPAAQALKALVDSGTIGDIRRIAADFAFRSAPNYEDRLFNRELGGGSLLDVGIYPLSLISFYKGELPNKVQVYISVREPSLHGVFAHPSRNRSRPYKTTLICHSIRAV